MSVEGFGRGTTPERVIEAIERAEADREAKGPRVASTTERERFFAKMAEEIKRAGGEP